jgi:hypothetical protein
MLQGSMKAREREADERDSRFMEEGRRKVKDEEDN